MGSERHTLIIGGGIVGLTVAHEALSRDPDGHVTLIEKEPSLARHQTGRNSGVVHSGLYYAPGSIKARTCTEGKALLESFARDHRIPFESCGKVVVATSEEERGRLSTLAGRAEANGVPHRMVDQAGLRELEPHVAGVAALHVPGSGIIDYVRTCEVLGEQITSSGRGEILRGQAVRQIRAGTGLARATLADGTSVDGTRAVNCAGLHSDRVARASGMRLQERIVPFRGEYFELLPEAAHLVRNLVYPVPDPRFPFLGVHFTRMVGGGIECGPNAVFALAREGYRWRDISPRDLVDALGFPGTWRLFARHASTGLGEVHRSVSKAAFVKALQRLVPAIRAQDLTPIPAGVRAQALRRDGTLVDDFLLHREGPIVHVINAPSPAATASFAIARRIVDQLDERP